MNNEMAYLIGMICGNGTISRGRTETIISIEIPHKKLITEDIHDMKLYVKASLTDIRSIIEPLISTEVRFNQTEFYTSISFTKANSDYLIREINRFVSNETSHNTIVINHDIYLCSRDQRILFMKGFSDVTAYIRRSNAYFEKFEHRVYIEVPNNWQMVIDICNILKSLDVPVQTIDWAHPNMRDGELTKYHQGNKDFWKKEHQIKIWANEFLVIGFNVLHKQELLEKYVEDFKSNYLIIGKDLQSKTHRYYWDAKRKNLKFKPVHPGESDAIIPLKIRGKHFNSWTEIAYDLGYKND